MKRTKKYFWLFLLALPLMFMTDLKAQELEVSPATLTFTTNPGSSQTQQITLRNKSNTEQSFVFNLSDWLIDQEGEVKYFPAGSTARSCTDWITVSPSLVTLQPNESARINVTMLVPNDNNSTKWAVLFVNSALEQTGPEAVDKEMKLGVQLALRIAVTIYQSPASNTLYKATIEGLKHEANEDNSQSFATKVINLGDKILNCKVYFLISNLETAEEIASDPIEFSLLPDLTKEIDYTLEEPLPPGNYSVAAILDYGYNEELEGVQLDIEIK